MTQQIDETEPSQTTIRHLAAVIGDICQKRNATDLDAHAMTLAMRSPAAAMAAQRYGEDNLFTWYEFAGAVRQAMTETGFNPYDGSPASSGMTAI